MAEYQVHFLQTVSISVTVEADDPEDAIEKAFDEAPSGVCAQCSGWGQQWGRDDDGELIPDAVTADGETVWSADASEEVAR